MIYLYDSYHTRPYEWADVLTPEGRLSIRGSEFDAVVFCLWTESNHEDAPLTYLV